MLCLCECVAKYVRASCFYSNKRGKAFSAKPCFQKKLCRCLKWKINKKNQQQNNLHYYLNFNVSAQTEY